VPVTAYDIVSVPAVTAVTRPPETVASPLLALHTPPVTASVRFTLEPRITLDGPVIVPAAVALVVKANVAAVPHPVLYDMVVVPLVGPAVTKPVPSTFAILVLLLLHVPLAAASLSWVVAFTHIEFVPVIIAGMAVTLTVVVDALPQPVLYCIVALPPLTPLTTPDDGSTVATDVLELLHVPLADASLSEVVLPWHTVVVPFILVGIAVTLTVVDAAVPQPVLYCIVTLPPVIPLTTPDAGSTVATPVLALLQVPLADASVSCVVDDWHTVVVPFMLVGIAVTLTVVAAAVPQPVLYCIVTLPPVIPLTTPDAGSTVATPVLPLLQVPLADASLSDVVLPWHTVVVPFIPVGIAVTLTVVVAAVPQPVLYCIVALPPLTPVTIPDEGSTVATLVLPLLHVPLAEASLNEVVLL